MIYYIIITAVISVDHIVKHMTTAELTVGATVPVINDVFHITYIQNTGAAFSMWEEQWPVLDTAAVSSACSRSRSDIP